MMFLKIDEKEYYIDMKKYIGFVSEISQSEKNNDTTITQTWAIGEDNEGQPSLELISKEVGETKSNTNDILYNFRYDFIKSLFTTLCTPMVDDNGFPRAIRSLSDMSVGQVLAFNTMLNAGIIVEINN